MLPISGGAFPVQLGLLAELLTHSRCPDNNSVPCKPDIVMGSSGGNIASYLTMAAEWDPEKVREIVGRLNSGMFAVSWWPRGLTWLPSVMIGYFKGSIYASGTGAIELFKECFTPQPNPDPTQQPKKCANVTDVELWVGTFNRTANKGQIFCNRAKEQCKIRGSDQDLTMSYWTRDILPLTYLNGNVDIISQVALASAAVPVMVEAKVIGDSEYIDGGTVFSSPLTPLQDNIRSLAESNPVHIDYISSFDMDVAGPVTYGTIYANSANTIADLVKTVCIQDRIVAIELLRKYPTSRIRRADYDGNERNLRFIEEIRKTSPLSILELYPLRNEAIDLLKFKPADILAIMDNARKNYGLRFWYITPGQQGESLRESRIGDV